MINTIVEVKNIDKKFGKLKAVNDLSFTVEKGDVFGFLGPNGSGKTTTIKIILGLLRPDKGDIYINNNSIKKNFGLAVSRVGALVEGPAFYEYMTAKENLEIFGSYSGGVTKNEIEEILELVGLANRANDKVKGYSLGMKQRLGIAQALLNDPELLILDEPINGLDPQGIKEIRNLIDNLSNKGITIFLSSHILSEIEQSCNKVLIINKGEKIISGLTKELLKIENSYEIGCKNSDKLVTVLKGIKDISIDNIDAVTGNVRIKMSDKIEPEDLIVNLINNGIKIRMYNPIKLSLEEYFFSIMR